MKARTAPLLSLGTLAGVVAIAAAVAGGATEATGSAPASSLGALTLLIVFAAGAVAVVRPRQVEALASADVLVSIAIVLELFSRLGMLYVPVLLLLGFATLRTRAAEERRADREAAAPIFAGQWGQRRSTTTKPESDSLRRAG
ncbi:MAG: hypothetical protein ABR600_11485 [Actinomycetota bacterium]